MTDPDYAAWVTGAQRVIATRNTGEQVRGAVSDYQPAQLTVDLDDGTRGLFFTRSVVAAPPNDPTDPVAAALDAVAPGQVRDWDATRAALDAAGYQVMPKQPARDTTV